MLLILAAMPAAAQVPAGMIPPDIARGMAVIDGYYDAINARNKGAAPAARPAAAGARERDPFQVTPELKGRGARRASALPGLAAPAGAADGPLPPIQVKALALGAGRFAVLAVEEAGKTRDLLVRQGECLQLADTGRLCVRRIDRDGVALATGPGEADEVLLK